MTNTPDINENEAIERNRLIVSEAQHIGSSLGVLAGTDISVIIRGLEKMATYGIQLAEKRIKELEEKLKRSLEVLGVIFEESADDKNQIWSLLKKKHPLETKIVELKEKAKSAREQVIEEIREWSRNCVENKPETDYCNLDSYELYDKLDTLSKPTACPSTNKEVINK